MTQSEPTDSSRRDRSGPALLITLSAVAALNAAAWFYFRSRQPKVDQRTRDRLQPRVRP